MSFTTRPELRGTFGAVASTHWLASAAGMGVLERGGNAFDAAVAAGFVLQVVEPHLNGPGGEVPILLWDIRQGRIEGLCGQGVAPAAASIPAFRALGLDLIPGTGIAAAAVPGAFDAWMLLLRDHGTISLRAALEPAIGYAAGGFPLVPQIGDAIGRVVDVFRSLWPTSAAQWLPGGALPEPGRLFRLPALAATWQRLLEEAEAASGDREDQIEAARRQWADGFIAAAIDDWCRAPDLHDRHLPRSQGFLAGSDMAAWRARVEAPVTLDFRGWTVAKFGPWSQGPVFLQQLALLDRFDLAAMDPHGAPFIHTVVECAKLAFADREAWYGDPDHVDVPLPTLLSPAYAAERARLVGEEASLALRPGSPDGRAPRLPPLRGDADEVGAGEPTVQAGLEGRPAADGAVRGDTCHLDVVDRWGNMVAATPSGGWLQSSPTIPALGFCLGTRLQMCWLEEGLAASLRPGARPRSTLTPTLALRDGVPGLAFGTPGGDQQDQWQVPFFLRHVIHGLNLQAAIDAPAWHSEHWPNSFWPRHHRPGRLVLEGRVPSAVIGELRRRGHVLTIGPDWSEGRLSAVGLDHTAAGSLIKAAANPRGMQGYAVAR